MLLWCGPRAIAPGSAPFASMEKGHLSLGSDVLLLCSKTGQHHKNFCVQGSSFSSFTL